MEKLYLLQVIYPSPRVDFLTIPAEDETSAKKQVEELFVEQKIPVTILKSKETTPETVQEDVDRWAEDPVTMQ